MRHALPNPHRDLRMPQVGSAALAYRLKAVGVAEQLEITGAIGVSLKMPAQLVGWLYLAKVMRLLGHRHENFGMGAQQGVKRGGSRLGRTDDEEVGPYACFPTRAIDFHLPPDPLGCKSCAKLLEPGRFANHP